MLDRPALKTTFRLVVLAAVVSFVIWKLHAVGWTDVVSKLPVSPAFYAVFFLLYMVGPTADALIYRRLWGTPWPALFPAMLRKRILNESVLGYSGEAFLAICAKRLSPAGYSNSLYDIRDSNVVSSFVSTTATLGLVAIVLSPAVPHAAAPHSISALLGFFGACAALIALVWAGRIAAPRFLRVSRRNLRFVFCGYAARLLLIMGLQIALWKIALPYAPIFSLVVILAAYQAATRIPFAPSYDVLLLGAGVSLAPTLNLPTDAVAGLLVANFTLNQTLNLMIWAATFGLSGNQTRKDRSAAQ